MNITTENQTASPAKTPLIEVRQTRILEGVVLAACALFCCAVLVLPWRSVAPLPDFSRLQPAERKAAFFDYLAPLLAEINAEAAADRDFMLSISSSLDTGMPLSVYERTRLSSLGARYEITYDGVDTRQTIEALMERTGTVPVSLALIQAAVESGWGTSRFAVEGNNLFGQRCYEPGCGIAPRRQADGASWGVARFDSVRESLQSYLLNLNTHPEYSDFRSMRQQIRQAGRALSGLALAESLGAYSERGREYIDEIKSMIQQNSLE